MNIIELLKLRYGEDLDVECPLGYPGIQCCAGEVDVKDAEIIRLKNILSGIHKGDVDILDSAIIAIEMVPCFEEGDEESQKRMVEGLRRLQAMCRMMVE